MSDTFLGNQVRAGYGGDNERRSPTLCAAVFLLLKKNLNASKLSEHLFPHRQGDNVKTLRWDHRIGCRNKTSWHLNGFPGGSNIGSTVV